MLKRVLGSIVPGSIGVAIGFLYLQLEHKIDGAVTRTMGIELTAAILPPVFVTLVFISLVIGIAWNGMKGGRLECIWRIGQRVFLMTFLVWSCPTLVGLGIGASHKWITSAFGWTLLLFQAFGLVYITLKTGIKETYFNPPRYSTMKPTDKTSEL